MEWCLREKNRSVNDRYLQETLEREFKENLRKGQTVRFVYYGGLLSGIYFEVYFRVGDCRLL